VDVAIAQGTALQHAELVRCLIPRFDGAVSSPEWKDALWARYYTEAPRRRESSGARSRELGQSEGAGQALWEQTSKIATTPKHSQPASTHRSSHPHLGVSAKPACDTPS
jgi:hypothetical protein